VELGCVEADQHVLHRLPQRIIHSRKSAGRRSEFFEAVYPFGCEVDGRDGSFREGVDRGQIPIVQIFNEALVALSETDITIGKRVIEGDGGNGLRGTLAVESILRVVVERNFMIVLRVDVSRMLSPVGIVIAGIMGDLLF
jgi:hypothetical protein